MLSASGRVAPAAPGLDRRKSAAGTAPAEDAATPTHSRNGIMTKLESMTFAVGLMLTALLTVATLSPIA